MYKNVAVFVIFYLFFFFIYLMGAGKHTGACFDFTNWGTWKVLLRESNLFCLRHRAAAAGKNESYEKCMDLRSLRITCQNVSWLIICKQLKGRYIQRWVASLHTVAQIMPENKCVLIRQSVSQEARVFSVFFWVFFSQEVSEHPSASYLPPLLHQHALVLPPWRHPVREFFGSSAQAHVPSRLHTWTVREALRPRDSTYSAVITAFSKVSPSLPGRRNEI